MTRRRQVLTSYPNTTTIFESRSASNAASSAVNLATLFDFGSNSFGNASHRQKVRTAVRKSRMRIRCAVVDDGGGRGTCRIGGALLGMMDVSLVHG